MSGPRTNAKGKPRAGDGYDTSLSYLLFIHQYLLQLAFVRCRTDEAAHSHMSPSPSPPSEPDPPDANLHHETPARHTNLRDETVKALYTPAHQGSRVSVQALTGVSTPISSTPGSATSFNGAKSRKSSCEQCHQRKTKVSTSLELHE